nr:nitroreductase family protein [Acetobacter persici]
MTSFPERDPGSSVVPLILNRWSPRAFVPAEIAQQQLLDLLDAGRWAPSAYNGQPWRFVYARRGTAAWERFVSWLIPFNRSWVENASALVYVASRTVTDSARDGEPVPAPSHAFDAGAAAVLIQLQANQEGWSTHPVSGFDKELAHAGLELPEDYVVHAAIVIGRRGDGELLPENLRAREVPSSRAPLNTLAFEDRFTQNS